MGCNGREDQILIVKAENRIQSAKQVFQQVPATGDKQSLLHIIDTLHSLHEHTHKSSKHIPLEILFT